MLAGTVVVFSAGVFVNWSLIDSFFYQQRVQRIEANVQTMTYTIRNVYITVSVRANDVRQISCIVSNRQIGDTGSIIQIGYNPVDILALASVQIHSPTWLFLYTPEKGFIGVNNKSGEGDGVIPFSGRLSRDVLSGCRVGSAQTSGGECFISATPILASSGETLSSSISSIGRKGDLYAIYDAMLKEGSIVFVPILLVALILVTMFTCRLFRPVPLLINSSIHIAHGETDCITSYLDQDDEIGHLAGAIEKLHVAMKECGCLQQMHEVS